MATLLHVLPQPKHQAREVVKVVQEEDAAPSFKEPPPYGKRKGFVPHSIEDFGDGGAFPEILVNQYPLDMGRKDKSQSKAMITLQVDADGSVRYDAIARQGMRKDQVVFSRYSDLVEKDASEASLARPSKEEEEKIAEKTRAALGQVVANKLAAAQPTNVPGTKMEEPVFIRYTPSQQNSAHNSGAKQRVIRLQEMPKDPMEPPRFKHKRMPGGPPSPPPPVMHSPPRKVTAEDQANWKIPPCVSNWKNIKGYTIPLDKRLAADGRGLLEVQVNDKFSKLAESLQVAERTARKEIEMRAKMLGATARKAKEAKEEELRALAARARAQATGPAREREEEAYGETGAGAEGEEEEDLTEKDAREELRRDRKRDIQRDMRMESMKDRNKASKRSVRDQDRDVSEKIALGQKVGANKDTMFDQRLFNQTEGVGSGFNRDESSYDVYSKPLFKATSQQYMYRGPKGDEEDVSEEQANDNVKKILEKTSSKFAPDRGFKGAEASGQSRSKPVAFEKQDSADPFGLGELLTEAKGGKRNLDGLGRSGGMAARAGGTSGNADDYRGHNAHSKAPQFEESRDSRSSRDDRDRERDRGSKRRDREDDDRGSKRARY